MGLPGGWELVLIVAVLVLLFGATKLPQMARSLGQSARVFKAEARGMKEDEAAAKREKETASEPQQLTAGEPSAPVTATNAEEPQRNQNKN
ncbi:MULTISPECIES: Sec-independent protein translocase subunit TatA [Saccharopolyspora]|uniref:Sec-independent protein translocase protein TatA n=1 Tax=Saccharopolyspora gregorii TaxID=33914 RepID=A0ABP6RQG8_9PSEU|nr:MULTISPECIES: Sec-independent protein translocase subunit TatA [Saccharopolyspora]MCA1189859.1 Sec-independent protein translocase subunit TatA [Saccharopolyspora sp. 6T]MCA1195512.1 Sec-independent protein translocase subunit TatA [Saccharopolyspora sp. 6V]MCA1282295.1 Sec-independent protein translocase subunit TatA [Saccharopolyspora sp. 7B]